MHLKAATARLRFISGIDTMESISRGKHHRYSMVVSRVLFPLIALSLFFLPLNGLPKRRLLGELSLEGAVYPMLIAVIIYGLAVIQKGKINKNCECEPELK